MHLGVAVMHRTWRSVFGRPRAVRNRGLLMATRLFGGRRCLMRHATRPRNERRERRHLEQDPGGRQKTQALAKCSHLSRTD